MNLFCQPGLTLLVFISLSVYKLIFISFTDGDRLVAQIFQAYAAGFEAISGTISYTLYELGKNNDVQDKLRAEIQMCLNESGGNSYESMVNMKYLDHCMHGKNIYIYI